MKVANSIFHRNPFKLDIFLSHAIKKVTYIINQMDTTLERLFLTGRTRSSHVVSTWLRYHKGLQFCA